MIIGKKWKLIYPEIGVQIGSGLQSQIQNLKIEFTSIIQTYDPALPIVITVTVKCLVGIEK